MSIHKKLVVVGDSACGKTSLLAAFTKKEFLLEHVPTTFENGVTEVEIDGTSIELRLWDVSGLDDNDNERLRSTQYLDTDVILICFSVVWKESLEHVATRWVPEVRGFCPEVPILLIGTKQDLQENPKELEKLARMKEKPVSEEKIKQIAKRIGAVCYMVCSAKTQFQVNEVFTEAAKATYVRRKKKNRCKSYKCMLM